MNSNKDLSIIIRAFNEEKHIQKLLAEIRRQKSSYKFEIILVDSGSTDRTVDIAKSFDVVLVQIKPQDFSFGYSLNRGIERSTSKYCAIISAHCYPKNKNWIENLISPFKDEDVALVYGKQRGTYSTRYAEQQIFAKWFPEESIDDQQHPFCNNANAAIRRSVWKETKYDENLTGLEDVHWASEILSKGFKIVYAAKASIVHIHEENNQQIFRRYKREAIAFKKLFSGEKFSILKFFHLLFMHIIGDYVHAFQDKELVKNICEIPIFRFMQFWGTYRGFKYKDLISDDFRRRFYYPRNPEIFNTLKKRKEITKRGITSEQI